MTEGYFHCFDSSVLDKTDKFGSCDKKARCQMFSSGFGSVCVTADGGCVAIALVPTVCCNEHFKVKLLVLLGNNKVLDRPNNSDMRHSGVTVKQPKSPSALPKSEFGFQFSKSANRCLTPNKGPQISLDAHVVTAVVPKEEQ